MLTNSSHASSCHGIFRALYVPDVAISALALLETQRGGGGRFPRRLGSAREAWKSGGFPHGSVQKNPYHFLLPMLLPSHFHPPFWLCAPSQHLLSFSRFTPPPSSLLPSPPSRLCRLDPSSCTAEICGRVAAMEFRLLVTRALALQASGLMLAV